MGELELGKRKRVLSGMRPTGRLHIGHYFGALKNWVALQNRIDPRTNELEFECFFPVVDWHALTTHYEDTSSIGENSYQITLDWLSVGLDPEKSTIFLQSSVLEHAELHLILSMITPLGWLERVPTYKEQIENLKEKDLGTYGFLGYPLLQSADIVLYGVPGQQLLVPVGEDQVPHVELTREITRTFNSRFGFSINDEIFERANSHKVKAVAELALGKDRAAVVLAKDAKGAMDRGAIGGALQTAAREDGIDNFIEKVVPADAGRFFRARHVLQEPDVMLTETPRLPGTDGRRMAKSYGNFISLSEPLDSLRAKARNMMTDPARVRRTDPGNPDVCPVFSYHKLFSPKEVVERVNAECRTAAIGCVDCKKLMADHLITWIEPIQAKRREFESHPQRVWDILDSGSREARKAARVTMERVREAIFGWDEARKSHGLGAQAVAMDVSGPGARGTDAGGTLIGGTDIGDKGAVKD
jgi:tryptophanyl-tRNA synthetase